MLPDKVSLIWSFGIILLYLDMENYLDQALDDIYATLVDTSKNPWPKHFTCAHKLDFIDTLVNHYTLKEEYEKCSKLVEIKNIIEDGRPTS
jgi:hypothetical protein